MQQLGESRMTENYDAKMTDETRVNGNHRNGYHKPPAVKTVEPEAVEAAPPIDVERRYAQIVGWGYHVPNKTITNHDLEQIVDTTDEWIRSRTGIEERHVAADPKKTTATLATAAARKALEVADVHPSKVDLIDPCHQSPEHIFPATASIVQDAIGKECRGL